MNARILRTTRSLPFIMPLLALGLRTGSVFATDVAHPSATAPSSVKGASPDTSAPAASPGSENGAALPAEPVGASMADVPVADPANGGTTHGVRAKEGQTELKAAEPVAVAAPAPKSSPPVARKTVFRWGAGLDLIEVWQRSRGFDVFSSNDLATHVGLLVELDVVRFGPRLLGSAELGWDTDSQNESALFQDFKAEFLAHNVHVGAKLRYQLAPFLAPHVRLGLGESWMRTQFEASGGSTSREFETKKWGTFALLGAGLTASIPANSDVLPGVVLEGGYLVSASMPLQLDPESSKQAISTSGAPLGSYGRSGPYLRLGAFVRY